MGFAMGEAKEILSLQMSWDMVEKCRLFFILIVMREEGNKKEGRRSNMKKIPNIALFGHLLKKLNTPILWCMITFVSPCLVYT